jgi:galactokinase
VIDLERAFRERAGIRATHVVRAPGRVNLIGEHTDYNDGHVLPMAIDRWVGLAGAPRQDGRIVLHAMHRDERHESSLDNLAPVVGSGRHAHWSDYLLGVAHVLQQAGYRIGGFEAVVWGNVPRGSGLSSSAAVEVATATLLASMFDLKLDPRVRARLAQRAECDYVGVQCGIMDQFASSAGVAGHAIWLDCRTLESRALPLPLAAHEAEVWVIDSGVRRGLVDSEFNRRRQECQQAVKALGLALDRVDLASLRDVSPADLERVGDSLEPTLLKRARHVVGEIARVEQALRCLEAGDLGAFGTLMNESHRSLRDDYAVSIAELDYLVGSLQDTPGVFGARLTGAGFGGCCVAIARREARDEVENTILPAYRMKFDRSPTLWACQAVGGAEILVPELVTP